MSFTDLPNLVRQARSKHELLPQVPCESGRNRPHLEKKSALGRQSGGVGATVLQRAGALVNPSGMFRNAGTGHGNRSGRHPRLPVRSVTVLFTWHRNHRFDQKSRCRTCAQSGKTENKLRFPFSPPVPWRDGSSGLCTCTRHARPSRKPSFFGSPASRIECRNAETTV